MARLARLLPSLMPDEPTTTDLDWTQLQGTTLEGGYQLESILAAEEGRASFKVKVLGDAAANAFANVFAMDAANAEAQVALWQQARRLKGANLSTPLGAGQTSVDGATLAYVVLRRPDEKLNEILRERALDRQEAGECLLAMIAALEELHAHGLVHGCVAPEHIFSIGESIKLSTDCVRAAGAPPPQALGRSRYKAPESTPENITPEADIWCLGATLVEVLTQEPCRHDCLPQVDKLASPFNTVARKCLDPDPAARASLGQIEALYRGRPTREPNKPQAAAAAASAAAAGVGVHASTAARPATPAPPAPPRRATLAPRAAAPASNIVDVEGPKPRPLWPYVAAGIVFALLLIWWLWPKHRAVAPVTTTAAAQTAAGGETATLPAANVPTAAASPAAAPPPTSKAAASGRGTVWRVVLYTYTREADAANKARSVNAAHPGLDAAAFSPSGSSPYLVVAGGRMSREDAARLLQKVRSLGLPRDAYIQNYAQ